MSYAVPQTRREAVLHQLRGEILSGELAAGTIIKDAEVAARLGVSITPIREAIVTLAAEGLVDIAPNRMRRVTSVSAKNALDLMDVMQVLACAGFAWGVGNLTESDLERMHGRLAEFEHYLRAGDTGAASAAGADFSTIVISASGNRELQTHVDLVVARTLRLLALTPTASAWPIWLTGYRETLALLDADDQDGAVQRYGQIYVDCRAALEVQLPAAHAD